MNYVEKGLKPGLTLLAERKYEELVALLSGPARELYNLARADLEKLVAIQVKEAKIEYDAAEHLYAILIGVAVAMLVLGLLAGGLLGRQTVRAIVRPLQRLNGVMQSVTEGKLDSRILVDRDDEIGVATTQYADGAGDRALQSRRAEEHRETRRRSSAKPT